MKMLLIFSSKPFYSDFVRLPKINDPISPYILDNPKFHPYFDGAIGAIDGTHFDCSGTAQQRAIAYDRKGCVTQNCLAACDFNHRFVYIFSGWEGSVSDSTMFNDARITDMRIPPDRYYLADAGFPICLALLIPFWGVRYHLAEWARAELWYAVIFKYSLSHLSL